MNNKKQFKMNKCNFVIRLLKYIIWVEVGIYKNQILIKFWGDF